VQEINNLKMENKEYSLKTTARMAGFCYLLGSLTSVYGQMIIWGKLINPANATETSANILSQESLFRLGFVSSFVAVPLHILWAVLFYHLFKKLSRTVSLFAVFTMLMACAMWTLSSFFYISPLLILKGKNYFDAFTHEQLQALSLMLIKLNVQSYDLGLVFFGLWCMVIGYLIFKSTFIPRIIGILEMLAGLGYLTLLWQPLVYYIYPYNLALAGPGEISLLFWLLIKGVRNNISTIDKQ
jgi:Domain of unknown function (DUF4386)